MRFELFYVTLIWALGVTGALLAVICACCCQLHNLISGHHEQTTTSTPKVVEEEGLSAGELDQLPRVVGREMAAGSECAVCLDTIEGEQLVRVVPDCRHGFHLQCADAWLSKRPMCPVCRAELKSPPAVMAADRGRFREYSAEG